MIIKNCPVTKTDSNVIKEYVVDENSKYVLDSKSIHTGVDIECENVYSVFDGVVIQCCMLDDHMSMIVQYNGTYCVRYAHLKSCECTAGHLVKNGDLLGVADEFVHFELLSTVRSTSGTKVTVESLRLFKIDPMDVVCGKMKFSDTPAYSNNRDYAIVGDYSTEPLDNVSNMTASMIQELTNGVDPNADIY